MYFRTTKLVLSHKNSGIIVQNTLEVLWCAIIVYNGYISFESKDQRYMKTRSGRPESSSQPHQIVATYINRNQWRSLRKKEQDLTIPGSLIQRILSNILQMSDTKFKLFNIWKNVIMRPGIELYIGVGNNRNDQFLSTKYFPMNVFFMWMGKSRKTKL